MFCINTNTDSNTNNAQMLYVAEYGPLSQVRTQYAQNQHQLAQFSDTEILRYMELLVVRKQADMVQQIYASLEYTHSHFFQANNSTNGQVNGQVNEDVLSAICRGLYGFGSDEHGNKDEDKDTDPYEHPSEPAWRPILSWLNSLAPETHQYQMHLYPHGWLHAIRVSVV
jgi:hypothetical protein